jgi:Kef-type K+ transport system membrane component KefB
MADHSLIFSMFLIFSGAAALASIALFTRQPLIVAYSLLGVLLGPHGFHLVADPTLLKEIGYIGIVFLLFLLGLDLQPRNFLQSLTRTAMVTVFSGLFLGIVGFSISSWFGYPANEAIIIGIAVTFSSTILGIKLLPTTVLHHKHTGELVISILLIQDILAIIMLIWLYNDPARQGPAAWISVIISLPVLIIFAFGFVRWIVMPLLTKFDHFHEYIFLLVIGWCLGLAELAEYFSLSREIGAFIAGISVANTPISPYIAESLKPLRDFFLIMFFFAIGAGFNLMLLADVWLPSLILATVIILLKPLIYRQLLVWGGEPRDMAWEVGFRLGQTSEFSLLIAFIALENKIIGESASLIIQATAIITFIVSSYIIIFRFPSPLALSARLRRD